MTPDLKNQLNTEANTAKKRAGLPFTCIASLVLVCALFLMPILLNTAHVFLNQLKWWGSGIDDYNITLLHRGLGGSPPQIVTVQDGQIVNSTIKIIRNGEVQELASSPVLDLSITDLFNKAYGCFLYTFCSVEYNAEYGYPSKIGGGFIEGSWVEVMSFELEQE